MIQIRYDREADALAVEFRRRARSARTVRVSDTVQVDFDSKGRLMTVEVLDASHHVERKSLDALPSATEWLTLAEAEKESGLRATTLRVLLNRGRLSGERRGRDWFVNSTALWNYLESRDARGRPATSPKGRRRRASG
jgi:uncharacterized protein YuzE